MSGMHTRRARFATLRQDAAPMLLLVFLLGAVLSPVLHLSVHRDDHSHGPSSSRTHAAAHRAGLPHDHHDAPAIRAIVRAAAADDYRWSSTILAMVKSAPFQMRRAAAARGASDVALSRLPIQPTPSREAAKAQAAGVGPRRN